ncbi:hypothetical protein [Actinoplanes flavus]|uniref:Uncharacterized protein n=1 Tax=Actinoplanes flavus TaxID=2820290 RepID=A0ABS3UVF1_9ACTN|nr:hypothetical protein [Actinoplanes flavus]MBO3742549.1 hypothetical protein [Actinoplanes flavus]
MNAVRGKALAWSGHPVTVTALVLLAVNDHVLKAVWPGWVTGKLSDAAGMVLAPPLLAAVTGLIAPRAAFRWVAPGAILTVGVGFLLVKATGYGAELASSAWSAVTPTLIRADPTDLLALPFLGVAWWVARRPVRPAPRWLRALRLAVFLPLALAGVAATSPAPHPMAQTVAVTDGALYLGYEEGYGTDWSVSLDGGLTWTDSAEGPGPIRSPGCSEAAPAVCYRAVPGEIGVASGPAGGPWTESWRLSDKDQKLLAETYPDTEVGELQTVSIGVLDVDGGHVVAAANGRDGFAVRAVSGQWQRIGFPGMSWDEAPAELAAAESASTSARVRILALLGVYAAGLIITVAGVVVIRRAGGSGHWWWMLAPHLMVGVVVLPSALLGYYDRDSIMAIATWVAPFPVGLVALVCTIVVVIAARAQRREQRATTPGRWY